MKSLKNTTTPRFFLAATRQNDGKTTTSLGLLAAIRHTFPRVGYIKPIGQRLIEIHHRKIDEDTVLMDRVYGLNCPLDDMSPIAVGHDFTRQYLRTTHHEALSYRIQQAFDRVAWEKDLVVCEGTGHAGVGSVFDLSNARVAKLLDAKVVIVTRGGIGRPLDEIALNHALFEKEKVPIIGVIFNKVIPEKIDYITELAQEGLRRQGLRLLGVIPHATLLSSPTVDLIREQIDAHPLNGTSRIHSIVDEVVIGSMTARSALRLLRPGVLLLLSGDRDDLMDILVHGPGRHVANRLAGIILTENTRPSSSMLERIRKLSCPVLLSAESSYAVATRVQEGIVKTRPDDKAKISLIRDLVHQHVDVPHILDSIT